MVDRLMNSQVNTRRLLHVEQCFGKGGMPLNVYGRVLVGEGVLVKMCRKKPKQRQFFLFNDYLVYGNIVISKKRYNKQRAIPLENVKLENLQDEGALKNGWVIRTPQKSFAVYAATPTEKQEWMIHIERSVGELLEKGKRSATEHAPVWVPDGDAARCMACGRTQFNLVQRRHHCRACGKVVCANCSSHTFKIDAVKKKPVRVCDQCFTELTRAKAEGQHVVTPPAEMIRENSDTSDSSDEEENKEDSKPMQGSSWNPDDVTYSYLDSRTNNIWGPYCQKCMNRWYSPHNKFPSNINIYLNYKTCSVLFTIETLKRKNGNFSPFSFKFIDEEVRIQSCQHCWDLDDNKSLSSVDLEELSLVDAGRKNEESSAKENKFKLNDILPVQVKEGTVSSPNKEQITPAQFQTSKVPATKKLSRSQRRRNSSIASTIPSLLSFPFPTARNIIVRTNVPLVENQKSSISTSSISIIPSLPSTPTPLNLLFNEENELSQFPFLEGRIARTVANPIENVAATIEPLFKLINAFASTLSVHFSHLKKPKICAPCKRRMTSLSIIVHSLSHRHIQTILDSGQVFCKEKDLLPLLKFLYHSLLNEKTEVSIDNLDLCYTALLTLDKGNNQKKKKKR